MAIVGASDKGGVGAGLDRVVEQNESSGMRVHLVNPKRDELFGRKAYPTLGDLPETVDTVLSLVNAELTLGVVEMAGALGTKAVLVNAANFGETDEAGKQRQRDLTTQAHKFGMAICGPNCNGILNAAKTKSIGLQTLEGIRPGGVGLISQSGGLMSALSMAGRERMLGFSYLVSSGNEAVTDLVDYIEHFIDDDTVTAMALVVEQIRRPEAFVRAAYAARAAGKPIVALKLGRSETGRRTGASHTGAMMGDARDYDALFHQVGIIVADDIEDLVDLVQMFSSVPRPQWTRSESIGVLCASGGAAGLISDAFDGADLPLKIDDELTAWMQELIPTNSVGNPFDLTGLLYNEADYEKVLQRYLESPTYDTVLVLTSMLGSASEKFNGPLDGPLRRAAGTSAKRLIVASSTACALGPWTEKFLDVGVAIGRGLVPTVRSLKAMDSFVAGQGRQVPPAVEARPRPSDLRTALDGDHEIVSFADAAALAAEYGVPMAPYVVLDSTEGDLSTLGRLGSQERYVVKLANVVHRSDIGAVATGVTLAAVPEALRQMAEIAARHGLASDVLVQPEVHGRGEVFLGAQCTGDLGPIVLFGLGGVFVELLADVSARLAPMTVDDALDMLGEIKGSGVLEGVRGGEAWDTENLASILVGLGNLASATSGWLESIEINPLLATGAGFAAVDLSCVVRR